MTGATGAVLGVELLRRLQQCPDIETHLVLARWARATIHLETELSSRDVEGLADVVHSWDEQAAAITFLASDDAAHITGTCLPLDGGATSFG